MTTTAQTEIGKIPGGSKNYSYPQNIAGIPFASFLRIYKYEYEEGMATVGQAQDDAIGALQNGGLLKNVTDGLGDTAQWLMVIRLVVENIWHSQKIKCLPS